MAEYAWREGGPKPAVDPNAFGRVKERIEKRDGITTPRAIVEEARNPRSQIHAGFEWRDNKAAERYRIAQAVNLLGKLQVVRVRTQPGITISSKAVFRVNVERERGGYLGVDRILGDRDLRKQVIGSAKRELQSFVSKYAEVLAMGRFISRLEEVINEMNDEIDALEVDANRRATRSSPGAQEEQASV